MMLDETGDKEGVSKASARLKNKQRQYEDYCDKAGLKQHNEHIQVLGFDRSVSDKVTSTYNQLLTWGNGDVTIGLRVSRFRHEIENGTVNLTIDKNNQPKHLYNKSWKNQVKQAVQTIKLGGKATPRSVLAKGLNPQDLINKYAGKGDGYEYRGNNLYPEEYITLPFIVGRTYNIKTGKYETTHRCQIKYDNNKGTHIFPVAER